MLRPASRDLSIVIVSYNTRELLRKCIASAYESLRASPDISYELIVVDNASNDGSSEMVATEFATAILVSNTKNLGFAAANNQALRISTGRFILCLNPDTEVLDDAIPRILAFARQHSSIGILGCALVNPDGSFQHSAFRFPTLAMTALDFVQVNYRIQESCLNGRYPRRVYRHPFEIDHPLGACMLIRRQTIEDVGLFDERFFIYCEEVDLCRRAKQGRWRIVCLPSARIIHHGAQSTRQFRGAMLIQLYKSRNLYFAKHSSRAFQCMNQWLISILSRREQSKARDLLAAGTIDEEEARARVDAFGVIQKMR